jgi:imidazolonepropionase-like amidohydrolase
MPASFELIASSVRRIALPLLILALQSAALPAADYLELTRFKLIDGTGAPVREVSRLLARDGRIVRIDDAGEVATASTDDRWTRVDLGGAWVMPGLIDTHVHVARFPDATTQAERILRDAVRGGITTVRDLGGDARALAELERRGSAEQAVLPEIVFGAMFGGDDIYEGGPTSQLARGRPVGDTPWTQRVTDDTDLPVAIALARGSGSSHIKLYGDIDASLATAVTLEARRQGVQIVAHATVFPARPSELVDAGVGTLSHAPYLVWEAVDRVPADYNARIRGPWKTTPADHPRLLALYRSMAKRGVVLDATLFVYRWMGDYSPAVQAGWAPDAFAWAVDATRVAHREGVRVSTGTDWFEGRNGVLPNTHEELAILVDEAGFTPMEAIVAGTRNGALASGRGASLGTVEVGKVADLLVLDADPVADIRNTTRMRHVIRRGVFVDRLR